MLHEIGFNNFYDTTLTRSTPRFADLARLHTALDTSSTVFGKATLLKYLLHPETTLSDITRRQDAVKELSENHELRESVQQFVDSFLVSPVEGEAPPIDKMQRAIGTKTKNPTPTVKSLLRRMVLTPLNSAAENVEPFAHFGKACHLGRSIKGAESPYLQDLLALFEKAHQHPSSPMIRGKICLSWGDVGARQEMSHLKPVWSFTNNPIDLEQMVLGSGMMAYWASLVLRGDNMDQPMQVALAVPAVLAGLILAPARLMISPMLLEKRAREKFLETEPFLKVIDAIGELDALLALVRFNARHAEVNCWPKMTESTGYRLEAKDLRSPYIHTVGSCVPNDVSLLGGRPLILTGPNSAGKSTYLNAVSHNTLLAQIGAKVLASYFESSVFDHLTYQGPDSVALSAEGRFGMEMLETKASFLRATKKSLLFLDEVAGGTSTEESRDIAQWIIHEGLTGLGCGAIMVTHDHELTRRLHSLGSVDCLELELENEQPTYRARPGIASSSRPDRVLGSINFTREDMHRILAEKNA
jgi:DNA mismatch repair protein MutS